MPNRLRGLRALVVEDEAVVALLTEESLEELGCVVDSSATCGTLETALAAVEANDFDIAVVDVNLRGEMSFPVADRLCERNKPFVFTTGYTDLPRSSAFRGVPVVIKPYRIATLEIALLLALPDPYRRIER